MDRNESHIFPQVEHHVLGLLRAHPAGLSEYDLLKALQQEECEGFPKVSLCEPLPLFRMHFVLFHVLYRLRDEFWDAGSGHLEIGPLCIRLQAYQAGTSGLTEHDPQREYYLDLGHLHRTTEADVEQLLGQFWQRFHAGEGRQAALRVLGLQEPVDYATVKRQYRALAMLHHPDRGGDGEMARALNEAMKVLRRYYVRG